MVNRLVSVGDDFTLPAAVKAADANLPARLGATALDATIAGQVDGALAPVLTPTIASVGVGSSVNFNPPFYSAVMLNRSDLGNGIVIGTNSVHGPMLVDVVKQQIFNYPYTNEVAGQSAPAGAFLTLANAGKMVLNRFGNTFVGVFAMPGNQWSVFTTPTAEPYVWTKRLDLTTDGTSTGVGTSIGTGMDGNSSAVFVSEYGDPKTGGAQTPKLWRSLDGGETWANVYTGDFRHIHAVACDPYNEGHVYMTSGDGDGAARFLKSTDNGTTWTTVYAGQSIFQTVQISFSTNYIWLAADADGIPAVIVDRATGAPKIAAKNSHMNIAVPGGAPGDMFHSQCYFGAFDSVTQKYYFVTAIAGIKGNRHGLFYIDKPGGMVHLLCALPDDFVPQVVKFITDGTRRLLFAGNLRAEITDYFAAEGTA